MYCNTRYKNALEACKPGLRGISIDRCFHKSELIMTVFCLLIGRLWHMLNIRLQPHLATKSWSFMYIEGHFYTSTLPGWFQQLEERSKHRSCSRGWVLQEEPRWEGTVWRPGHLVPGKSHCTAPHSHNQAGEMVHQMHRRETWCV